MPTVRLKCTNKRSHLINERKGKKKIMIRRRRRTTTAIIIIMIITGIIERFQQRKELYSYTKCGTHNELYREKKSMT